MLVKFQFDPTLEVSFEAGNLKGMIKDIAFLHQLPHYCPMEHPEPVPVRFFFREPKGFSYYGLECLGSPKHQANFGIHQTGDGLFYKGDESWELEYQARSGQDGGQQGGSGLNGPAQPSQPAGQQGQTSPTGDKAPIDKLNMIGAVARAKKVADLDVFCQKVLGDLGLPKHTTGDLTASEADIVLEMLKAL